MSGVEGSAMQDPLAYYFVLLFEDTSLCDAEPIQIILICRSFRSGREGESNRLGRFMMAKKILEESKRMKGRWVFRPYGHSSSIRKERTKTPGPFKFNHSELEEECFKDLVIKNWRKYLPNSRESTMF